MHLEGFVLAYPVFFFHKLLKEDYRSIIRLSRFRTLAPRRHGQRVDSITNPVHLAGLIKGII
jgi:hypothetical protein